MRVKACVPPHALAVRCTCAPQPPAIPGELKQRPLQLQLLLLLCSGRPASWIKRKLRARLQNGRKRNGDGGALRGEAPYQTVRRPKEPASRGQDGSRMGVYNRCLGGLIHPLLVPGGHGWVVSATMCLACRRAYPHASGGVATSSPSTSAGASPLLSQRCSRPGRSQARPRSLGGCRLLPPDVLGAAPLKRRRRAQRRDWLRRRRPETCSKEDVGRAAIGGVVAS